ncbi:hypothetical protein O6H91_15G019300 [Diphasiastrum complanatum]|uniref:Uncharacterized protein n=1 Tax=Diphasiastrum complanatum TaxID=34168 RepID=A0ACC2BG60_DIPCM|nr:hypothetical protein O6H91_15G019300 [Diphasiastrum complanatum]
MRGFCFIVNVSNLPEPFYKAILVLLESGVILGIYSIFSLGLVLVHISLSYLLLNADSAAAVQSLIYAGTINVVIVFAVMLINKPQSFLCSSTYLTIRDGIASAACAKESLTNNIQRIGSHLLTDFSLPFELSINLLVALVEAIAIARQEETIGVGKSEALKTTNDFPIF